MKELQGGSGLSSLLERRLKELDPIISAILDRALDGAELRVEEALQLFEAKGQELEMIALVADELRRRSVGEIVTYVVNRNINYTNVCIKRCGFCAFSRDYRSEEGYFLPLEEVVRRAKEARALGATEVCIQGGLPPRLDPYYYVEICRAIKREVPDLHIHAFSPEEIKYACSLSGLSAREYLLMLKEAGLGSLPGTAAEILDDELRRLISPGRIKTAEWVHIIKTAHSLGIPTTSTMMFGHVETSLHKAKHIALLREIQKETRGFTEFVPLSFVYWEAPMYKLGLVAGRPIKGVRKGATGEEVLKVHAVARLMLNGHIDNIQVSWVKEGPKLAQLCLNAGANDLGGTLINESISTAAGAPHGQLMRPSELRALIRGMGRVPAERSTTYRLLKVFDGPEVPEPLDLVEYSEERFGSYQRLIRLEEFKYKRLGVEGGT
jgi:7,8-didemethyl-8-hydroxy-5-deazariboflavin synthase CofH subunit